MIYCCDLQKVAFRDFMMPIFEGVAFCSMIFCCDFERVAFRDFLQRFSTGGVS